MRAIITLAAAITASSAALARPPQTPIVSEFDDASIRVERNATDDDTEIVITATGVDEGLRLFRVRSPDGRTIVSAHSHDPTVMGQREFLFESPEPPGDAILAAYPEGVYRFTGVTHENALLRSKAVLSHKLPQATVILWPMEDASVPAGPLTVAWSAVPGVAEYLPELKNESADPEQTLSINLPADTTSFDVPASFIVPGAEYQLGVATVGKNGNIVFVEIAFETGE